MAGPYGNRYYAGPAATGYPADELSALRSKAELLNDTLKTINDRIDQLEKRL
jgi:hypothetical protein